MKRIAILILFVICAVCTSCQGQQQPEKDSISEEQTAGQVTAEPDNSSPEEISEDGFTVCRVELPETVDTSQMCRRFVSL